MKFIKLTIGEKTYTVNELPRKKNAAWREAFQNEFVEIASFIQGLAGIEVSSGEVIANIVEQVAVQVNGAIDRMADLLISYSPEMTADRSYIDENAYDSQILDGFTAVLGLAYPFGSLMKQLQTLVATGRSTRRITRN
ncbi:MAG: hypothetical protein H6658_02075 [Ardenticatenaceae bacterium]|nr:hypothetical protein [Ardenticatenaceae bacterium]